MDTALAPETNQPTDRMRRARRLFARMNGSTPMADLPHGAQATARPEEGPWRSSAPIASTRSHMTIGSI